MSARPLASRARASPSAGTAVASGRGGVVAVSVVVGGGVTATPGGAALGGGEATAGGGADEGRWVTQPVATVRTTKSTAAWRLRPFIDRYDHSASRLHLDSVPSR